MALRELDEKVWEGEGPEEQTVTAVMLRMMVLEMTLGPVQDGLLKRRLV